MESMKKFALVALLTVLSQEASGQPLHYELNEKLVYLPVQVNGSRVFWFALDSGARHTVIDTAVAKELKLKIVSDDSITGVGKGSVAMRHAADTDVSIAAVHLRVKDPWVIDLNASHASEKRLDGLIGADFFAAYVIRIDPEARTIAFHPAKHFVYRGRGAAVPVTFADNRLFVDLTLAVRGRKPVVHRVRIDTGSNDAVSDDLVKQSPERRKSLQGVGLGQPYVDYSGVLDRVTIGPYTIRHSWGPSNPKPAMGMEILRRFTLTFDVTRGRLYLEPNARFAEPVPAPPP